MVAMYKVICISNSDWNKNILLHKEQCKNKAGEKNISTLMRAAVY